MSKRLWAGILVAVASVSLAACGMGATGYGNGPVSPTTPSSSGATTGAVKTATVTVNGNSETVLTNSAGMTLYYFTPDSATAVACKAACITVWPPLLAGSGAPTSSSGLPGTLAVLNSDNGRQVTYNGHPLYLFSGDSKPGDAKGEGLQGKWFVATPGLTVLTASGGTAAPTPTSGY